jgi:hypothetical protein
MPRTVAVASSRVLPPSRDTTIGAGCPQLTYVSSRLECLNIPKNSVT